MSKSTMPHAREAPEGSHRLRPMGRSSALEAPEAAIVEAEPTLLARCPRLSQSFLVRNQALARL